VQNFYEIMTAEELWTWMRGPLLNGAYPTEWYNGDPFTPNELGLVMFSARLVGGVQLRQMRVRPDSCARNKLPAYQFPINESLCYGPFTPRNEAKDPFGPGGVFKWTEGHHALEGLFGYGPAYGRGGYVTELPPDRQRASDVLSALERVRWVDRGTRAVMIMMNLYNPQTDLLTVVRLLVEMFPSGHIVKSFKFYSFQAGLYDGNLSYGRAVFEVFLLVSLIGFILREVRQMFMAPSVSMYLSSLGNAFEVTLYVLVILFVAYWILFLLAPDRLAFSVSEQKFRDIFAVAERYVYVFTIAGFIGLLFTLKLFRYFSVSLQMQALFNTMMRAAPDLFAFMFGFVLLVAGFSFSGTMLWGSTVSEFHSLAAAFSSLLRLSLGDFDYAKLSAAQPVVTGYFFALYVTIVYLIAMNILIAIVTMYFEEVTRLIKQEDSWKQSLPSLGAEVQSLIVEAARPACRGVLMCGYCRRSPAAATAEGARLSPLRALRAAEDKFTAQLAVVMDLVERQRGRGLEEFLRDIFLERKPGQRLYMVPVELQKLCRAPMAAEAEDPTPAEDGDDGQPQVARRPTAPDSNMLRRNLRCLCPLCCGRNGFCTSGGFALCPEPRPQPAALADQDWAIVFRLYAQAKRVTLVGDAELHKVGTDTFEGPITDSEDFSFMESSSRSYEGPDDEHGGAGGVLHRQQTSGLDRMGNKWFVVKKINAMGKMQTRRLLIWEKSGVRELQNFDRQGFLRKRFPLSTLAQVEEVQTDSRMVGVLFVPDQDGVAQESIISGQRDSKYNLIFETTERRDDFVAHLLDVAERSHGFQRSNVTGARTRFSSDGQDSLHTPAGPESVVTRPLISARGPDLGGSPFSQVVSRAAARESASARGRIQLAKGSAVLDRGTVGPLVSSHGQVHSDPAPPQGTVMLVNPLGSAASAWASAVMDRGGRPSSGVPRPAMRPQRTAHAKPALSAAPAASGRAAARGADA